MLMSVKTRHRSLASNVRFAPNNGHSSARVGIADRGPQAATRQIGTYTRTPTVEYHFKLGTRGRKTPRACPFAIKQSSFEYGNTA